MKLILFRHGKTLANERHLYCGSTDLPLSDTGIRELRALRVSGSLPTLRGYQIITSGARRCNETLFELYGPLPFSTDPAFREMDFGDFEMRSYEELKTDPKYIAWIAGDNDSNVAPDGESGAIMRSRVLKALNRLLSQDHPTALFTHGGPIAAIMQYLFPGERKTLYQWQPTPGHAHLVDTKQHLHLPL